MIWLVMWSGLKELKRNTNTTHWNKNDWNHSRRKCYEIMENFKANWIWENCYKSCFYLSSSNLITSHSRDGSTPSDSATALVQPALKNAVYYGHSSLSFLFKIHYILTAFHPPPLSTILNHFLFHPSKTMMWKSIYCQSFVCNSNSITLSIFKSMVRFSAVDSLTWNSSSIFH